MFGQGAFGSLTLGEGPGGPPAVVTFSSNPSSYANTTYGKASSIAAQAAIQAAAFAGNDDLGAYEDAWRSGVSASLPVNSEQAADATAAAERVARVFYAVRSCELVAISIVLDSTIPAMPSDYAVFTLKKFSNGGAIGSALAIPITTSDEGFTARTKRSFSWENGAIHLTAGDMLVVDITKVGLGVALPKFQVIGTTRSV